MDGPISPLEIPHIVDLIAQYLRKRDLYACTLVSKAFYEEFRRLYWQHIRIGYDSDDSEDSMITHIPESPSFLKNGHFIRKLDIIEGRPGNLLKLLTSPLSPCTNLLELEHVAEEPYEHGSPHILLANLVKRNTRLRRLRVILEEDGVEAKICSALIDVLSKHPSLTDLDLSVTQYFHFYGYEEDFLQNLPKNLETLRLDYVNGSDEARYEEFEEEDEGDEDNDDSKSDDDDNNDNDASSSWRHIVYPSLKSITLTSGIGKSEAATLFQFIRKCSTLESLRLMDIPESLTGEFIKLIGNARKLPNLKDLHFETPVLTMSDWTQLLKSMRERINVMNEK
ncbi:hypothetical protein BGX27_010179 [Mortierella sp. AM989]|nr:hypothetical protein BGX27_010179 [Mortierella sp. AM989]